MFLLIDYRMGNLRSVGKAPETVGAAVTVTATPPDDFTNIAAVVLPGVGHFAAAMQNLQAAGWVDFLAAARAKAIPYLGLCLGLQVLYEGSEEAPGVAGLGVIPGTVRKFPPDLRTDGRKLTVPHMGWNQVAHDDKDPLWAGVPPQSYFYFVHSYYAPVGPATAATCAYGQPFTAAVRAGTVRAFQFHPEKSQAGGLRLLENFVQEVRR